MEAANSGVWEYLFSLLGHMRVSTVGGPYTLHLLFGGKERAINDKVPAMTRTSGGSIGYGLGRS